MIDRVAVLLLAGSALLGAVLLGELNAEDPGMQPTGTPAPAPAPTHPAPRLQDPRLDELVAAKRSRPAGPRAECPAQPGAADQPGETAAMRFSPGRGRLLPALIAAALLALAGCEPKPDVLVPLATPGALQPAAPRVNSVIQEDRNRLPVFEARTAAANPAIAEPPPSPGEQIGDISLNFVDTDIREIVRVVLGATRKLNYPSDPSVQGTATLEVGKPLPRSALLPTLETLLNQNGATLTMRDSIYRVVPLATGAVTGIVSGAGAVGSGTQVVQLRFAAAKDLVKVLEP